MIYLLIRKLGEELCFERLEEGEPEKDITVSSEGCLYLKANLSTNEWSGEKRLEILSKKQIDGLQIKKLCISTRFINPLNEDILSENNIREIIFPDLPTRIQQNAFGSIKPEYCLNKIRLGCSDRIGSIIQTGAFYGLRVRKLELVNCRVNHHAFKEGNIHSLQVRDRSVVDADAFYTSRVTCLHVDQGVSTRDGSFDCLCQNEDAETTLREVYLEHGNDIHDADLLDDKEKRSLFLRERGIFKGNYIVKFNDMYCPEWWKQFDAEILERIIEEELTPVVHPNEKGSLDDQHLQDVLGTSGCLLASTKEQAKDIAPELGAECIFSVKNLGNREKLSLIKELILSEEISLFEMDADLRFTKIQSLTLNQAEVFNIDEEIEPHWWPNSLRVVNIQGGHLVNRDKEEIRQALGLPAKVRIITPVTPAET